MRTRGEGGLEKIGDIWYFSFYNLNGKQVRRSSRSPLKSVAIAKLQKAQDALRKGHEPASAFKLKYEDLRSILVADYTAHGKAVMAGDDLVVAGKKGILTPLDDFFAGMAVQSITTDVLREFVADRKAHGVSGPSCNRYFARLRRMFKLAHREGKVSAIPYFPMSQESEPREGFVERPDFERLRSEMPVALRPALTFCYETGCRTGAMKRIVWPWVNLETKEMHLPAGVIKNRKPLVLPLSTELVTMLEKLVPRHGPVFATTNFRREWNRACVKIGVGKKTGEQWYQYEGLIPHDFRRSAVRNLIAAGVPETTAMRITGHRTRAVFDRYSIVSTAQLHDAMTRVSDNAKTTQNASLPSGKQAVNGLESDKWTGSSMVEQLTLNQRVGGSSPPRFTTSCLTPAKTTA
jgi:integrase